ncbi:hypothetical protein Tco_0962504 [Tanacetum coccineum]
MHPCDGVSCQTHPGGGLAAKRTRGANNRIRLVTCSGIGTSQTLHLICPVQITTTTITTLVVDRVARGDEMKESGVGGKKLTDGWCVRISIEIEGRRQSEWVSG